MKKSINILLFGFIILLWGCDDPIENIDIVLDTDDIINTTVAVELTNASDGSLVNEFAEVSITGPDASMVLDLIGERNYTTAGDGLLTLILHPDAQPSASNPINFTINAIIDGYEDFSKDVIITDIGNSVEVLDLINLDEPPTGLLFLQGSVTTDENGQLRQDFNITDASENSRIQNLGFNFNINFPSGTKFLDQSGNPLFGVVNFATRISNSANPLGGFIRNTTDGDPYSVFADAQFSIEVTVNGIKAYATSNDFDFEIDFNQNFSEADLQVLFQVLGQDPQEINTSNTIFNGSTIFAPSSLLGLFDFSIRNRIIRTPILDLKEVPVFVSSNIVPEIGEERFYTDQFSYTVLYIDPITSEEKIYIRNRKSSFSDGSSFKFRAAPGIDQYKIIVKNDFGRDLGSADLTASFNNTINLIFPNEAINFKLIGTCNGGDILVGPTATIYYMPVGSALGPKLLGTIQSGKMVSYKLEQGVEYEFSTRFNGNVVSAKGKIDTTSYTETRELPANICDNF